MEASRLGATVIGVDVDPVACTVTEFELELEHLPDLQAPLEKLKKSVGASLRPLYTRLDAAGVEHTVLHYFWVQVVDCQRCGRPLSGTSNVPSRRDQRDPVGSLFHVR